MLELRRAEVLCESCGRATPHRVLKAVIRSGGRLEGIGRCQVCRVTHPFKLGAPKRVPVKAIVSDGAGTHRSVWELEAGTQLRVGSTHRRGEHRWTLRRLESDGRPVATSFVAPGLTVWATPDRGHRLSVSLIEGGRSRTENVLLPPETGVTVGDWIDFGGQPARIVGLRARGATRRIPGVAYPARDVERIYARRASNPPAGRRDWSTARGIPSSRLRETSRASRSRSGPGTSR